MCVFTQEPEYMRRGGGCLGCRPFPVFSPVTAPMLLTRVPAGRSSALPYYTSISSQQGDEGGGDGGGEGGGEGGGPPRGFRRDAIASTSRPIRFSGVHNAYGIDSMHTNQPCTERASTVRKRSPRSPPSFGGRRAALGSRFMAPLSRTCSFDAQDLKKAAEAASSSSFAFESPASWPASPTSPLQRPARRVAFCPTATVFLFDRTLGGCCVPSDAVAPLGLGTSLRPRSFVHHCLPRPLVPSLLSPLTPRSTCRGAQGPS